MKSSNRVRIGTKSVDFSPELPFFYLSVCSVSKRHFSCLLSCLACVYIFFVLVLFLVPYDAVNYRKDFLSYIVPKEGVAGIPPREGGCR